VDVLRKTGCNIVGRRLQSILAGNTFWSPLRDLAPLLRRIVFVGKAALGAGDTDRRVDFVKTARLYPRRKLRRCAPWAEWLNF
jgi:hypothetical protein